MGKNWGGSLDKRRLLSTPCPSSFGCGAGLGPLCRVLSAGCTSWMKEPSICPVCPPGEVGEEGGCSPSSPAARRPSPGERRECAVGGVAVTEKFTANFFWENFGLRELSMLEELEGFVSNVSSGHDRLKPWLFSCSEFFQKLRKNVSFENAKCVAAFFLDTHVGHAPPWTRHGPRGHGQRPCV